jgi:dihydroflavonol-4-reductase
MAAMLGSVAGMDAQVRRLSPRAARLAATVVGSAYGLVRRQAPICSEMVATMLHGHAFDGSRAERELGLSYTPAAETFRRMVGWYREQGLL